MLQQLKEVLQRYAELQQQSNGVVGASAGGTVAPGGASSSSSQDAVMCDCPTLAEQAGQLNGAAGPPSYPSNSSTLAQYRAELLRLARQLPRVNRLTFSSQTLMWVVRVQTRSARVCRSFSVRKFGFLEARQQALEFLKHFDEAATNPAAAAHRPPPSHAGERVAATALKGVGSATRKTSAGRQGCSSNGPEPTTGIAAAAATAAIGAVETADAPSLCGLGDNAAMAAAVAACAYLSRQRHQQQRQKAREDMALRARLLPHKVGVKFDPTCPRWIAHWKRNGQRFFKSFSVEKNGFETAWDMAVNCRRANCEDYDSSSST